MFKRLLSLSMIAAACAVAPTAIADQAETRSVTRALQGGVNPYLWRASLDTLEDLPLLEQPDPIGGVIIYDWYTFDTVPTERIKATVYILDTRLRADGVKVAVFRQERAEDESWVDAPVDPATPVQIENKILERARLLKNANIR
ncbi:MAG: DUF3576 domain-containing protein [Pseudomonadota bacterium]